MGDRENKEATTASESVEKPTVFISYSHKDEEWRKLLVVNLSLPQGDLILEEWNDQRIAGSDTLHQEIQDAMTRAFAAVLLISADYLSSVFALGEVQTLLQKQALEGLPIFPIIVHPCPWQSMHWLSKMQVLPKNGIALSDMDLES